MSIFYSKSSTVLLIEILISSVVVVSQLCANLAVVVYRTLSSGSSQDKHWQALEVGAEKRLEWQTTDYKLSCISRVDIDATLHWLVGRGGAESVPVIAVEYLTVGGRDPPTCLRGRGAGRELELVAGPPRVILYLHTGQPRRHGEARCYAHLVPVIPPFLQESVDREETEEDEEDEEDDHTDNHRDDGLSWAVRPVDTVWRALILVTSHPQLVSECDVNIKTSTAGQHTILSSHCSHLHSSPEKVSLPANSRSKYHVYDLTKVFLICIIYCLRKYKRYKNLHYQAQVELTSLPSPDPAPPAGFFIFL